MNMRRSNARGNSATQKHESKHRQTNDPQAEPDTFEANVPAVAHTRELIDATPANSGEMARSGQQSYAIAEIQAAVIMALQNPRNEDDAYGRLLKACQRPTFQIKAIYRFPRGDAKIKGPSVHLAREGARVWHNIRYGFYIVFEDDERVQVRGYAWDLETGGKVEQDACFRKLVYRKKGGWIKPDERDLRELVNKHGSICERNSILKLLPPYMIEDAMAAIEENQRNGVKDTLEEDKRKIVRAFADLNVDASELEEYLGHPLKEVNADELIELRQVFASIRDGNSHWSNYRELAGKDDDGKSKAPAPQTTTMDDLTRPSGDVMTSEPDPERSKPVGFKDHVGPVKQQADIHGLDERGQAPVTPVRGSREPAPTKPRSRVDAYQERLEAAGTIEAVETIGDDATGDHDLSAGEYRSIQGLIEARLFALKGRN